MLTSLPENIFSGLSILSTLNLEMNLLQDMHPRVFVSTPHLDSLRLGYNIALGKSIMKTADFLTVVLQKNLSYLALNNMSITKFPDYLLNETSQLRHLSLADNPMKVIEKFPASLDTLNLSGIEVEVILPGDFKAYPNLKNLHLDRLIHLKSVQNHAFEGLKSLEVLTMENCIQLHEFDERAFGGHKSVTVPLKRLSLSRCGLHTLSSKTLVPLEPTLELLALDGNPWLCDCKLAWIRRINFSMEHTEYLRQVYTISNHVIALCTQFRNMYGNVLLLKHCA
jgi:Leucine-rich repeat (LRR) protein